LLKPFEKGTGKGGGGGYRHFEQIGPPTGTTSGSKVWGVHVGCLLINKMSIREEPRKTKTIARHNLSLLFELKAKKKKNSAKLVIGMDRNFQS